MTEQMEYNLDFWKNYDWSKVDITPSTFAQFCLSYMEPGQTVLDVCCGNGRDSKYFEQNGMSVSSFDHETLNLVDEKHRFELDGSFDYIYCRFVLHCIPEHLEDYVLINSNNVLNVGGVLFIEVRSDKGEIPARLNNHYRRLINIDELRNKLLNLNFEIIEEKESSGFSTYNDEDPILIRFIVRKLGKVKIAGKESPSGKINVIDSYHILMTVKKVLNVYNIPFLLVFGTLLGAYREKSFIKHDTDIDIALSDEDKEKVLYIINAGFFAIYGLCFISNIKETPHVYALLYKNDYIDLWFYKRGEERYEIGRKAGISFDQIDNGFCTITFYGEEFKTVHDIETYLAIHYSPEWRIPKENQHSIR